MLGLRDGTAVTIASAFVFGMLLALLGSIKLHLAKRLDLSETRIGWLLSALNLALLPMMVLSGMLIDEFGPRGVLIFGGLITASALFVLSQTDSYARVQFSILAAGIGGACLSTGSIVLMPRVFFPGNEAASLNLGNVFFGLGALVTPALADLLLTWYGYRRGVGLLSVLCLIPALLALIVSGQQIAAPPGDTNFARILSDPIVWLAGLVFFFYGPLEGSIGTWATTFLTDLGSKEHRASLLLSGFWLTFLGSRLALALLQRDQFLPKSAEPWLIVGLALAAGVCLGNLAGTRSQSGAAMGLLLIGACLGPIFPTLVAILYQAFDQHEHGTAYGAMFSIGSVGSLILAPLMGAYARRTSVQRAMRVPTITALILALVTIAFALVRNLLRPA